MKNKSSFLNKGPVSLLATVVLTSFLLVAVVEAATTISTNISTGGTLTVTGASSFTGLASFGQASSTRLSVFDTAYFGGSATSTFSSTGSLTLVGLLAASSTAQVTGAITGYAGYYFGNGFKIDEVAGTTTEIGIYDTNSTVIIIFDEF